MTYGYRLSIEDLYFKSADEHWKIAKKEMSIINDTDPNTVTTKSYRAPISEKGVSSAVQAVVGWAISLEAFVNLAWNLSIAPNIPTKNLNKKLIKHLNTIEKIKEILNLHQVSLENKSWLSELKYLFDLRNKLIHFKSSLKYVGFSCAPDFIKDFEESRLNSYRMATVNAIEEIGKVIEMRTDFLNGNYKIIYYDE